VVSYLAIGIQNSYIVHPQERHEPHSSGKACCSEASQFSIPKYGMPTSK